VLLVLGAALGSTIGEGHVPELVRSFFGHSLVFEEMAELVGYMAMVTAQGIVLRYKAPVPVAAAAKAPLRERAAETETVD
jgi:hypothetical protein